MELEDPLEVHLVVLVQQLLLLAGEDDTCHSREKDRETEHFLNSQSSCWTGSMTTGRSTMKDSIHSLAMGSHSVHDVSAVVRSPDHAHM